MEHKLNGFIIIKSSEGMQEAKPVDEAQRLELELIKIEEKAWVGENPSQIWGGSLYQLR